MRTSKLGAEALLTQRGGIDLVTFPRLADPKVLAQAVTTRWGGVSRKNYAELQKDCISDLMIAAKRVMVNDPVKQRACKCCQKPGPEHQPAQFNV